MVIVNQGEEKKRGFAFLKLIQTIQFKLKFREFKFEPNNNKTMHCSRPEPGLRGHVTNLRGQVTNLRGPNLGLYKWKPDLQQA